jgi:tRNA(fMet)-specific endonuclease VapC
MKQNSFFSCICANLKQKGITIGTSDILITGIAIENELTLITNNERHYESIQGLKIENWKKWATRHNTGFV